MTFVNLILTEESSQAVVRELGSLGCIQFVDLNPELTAFQRPYVTYIKRCEELERKIRYCSGEVTRLGITIHPAGDVDEFVMNKGIDVDTRTGAYLLEGLESELQKKEAQLRHLVEYNQKLSKQYNDKVEYHHLLVQASKFLDVAVELNAAATGRSMTSNYPDTEQGIAMNPIIQRGGNAAGEDRSYQGGFEDVSMSFSNISGVINVTDKARFERMLFRATRGNCYIRFAEVPRDALDAEGNAIDKSCFVIFYKSTALDLKITRICDAFGASRYDLSMINSPSQLRAVCDANYQDLLDSKLVLDTNTALRVELCEVLASTLERWFWIVKREKSVYHSLNMFKSNVAGAKQIVRARGWLLAGSMQEATAALTKAHASIGIPQSALFERVHGSWPNPPTHFRTNKYTYPYQEFVNTYGMPRYREINPALFAAATFPFLFGVMYGDIGHGTLLSLGALYLVFTEGKMKDKRSMDDMLYNIYTARYMLLGMGLCAVYCGLVYNDFLSLGLNLFGSRYEFFSTEKGSKVPTNEPQTGDKASLIGASGDPAGVYPFGIDPVWHIAGNELLFFNSMKMKMSVIMGITQMTWGILLRGMNSYNNGGFGVDFFCEFLPMIIFDVFFMGYMIVLIFMKWAIDWDYRMGLGTCGYDSHGTLGGCNLGSSKTCYSVGGDKCDMNTPLADLCPLDYGGTGDGCQPPNLIITLMNIALKPGAVEEPMYYGQAQVQVVLLLVAFLCIPWLLVTKPYFVYRKHQAEHSGRVHHYTSLATESSHGGATLPMVNEGVESYASGGAVGETKSLIHRGRSGSSNGDGTSASTLLGGERRSMSLDSTDSHDSMLTFGTGGEGGYYGGDGHGHGEDGEEFNFGEICIHQAIETIEFVLGMISNAASYLRLWALSLAHSELATVFWEKAMVGAIKTGNPVMIFMGFYVFAAVSGAVLLCMDVLECFLHALRLHWVEFQNKFYKADGYRFQPFSFHSILDDAVLS